MVSRAETVEYHPTIKDLPLLDRPRERLRDYGAAALSNAELLAIILRTGTSSESVVNMAVRLLVSFGGLSGLARSNITELCEMKGLGMAKAAQLKAALELGKRLLAEQPQDRVVVSSPADVANILQLEMGLLEQEHLRTVLLNTKNQVMSIPTVYQGSVNTSLIRIAEVFREAIRGNCPALVVVHNHPSGDPTPSREDINVTKQMVEAGKLLDIDVLDHIVIGRHTYVSLKERGLGF